MNRAFLTAVVGAVLTGAAQGAADIYINNDIVTTPLVIDATNFVNHGIFNLNTGGPYDFSSVLNFTNENLMRNGIGGSYATASTSNVITLSTANLSSLRFDTAPPSSGSRKMAANFFNGAQAGNPVTNASVYADYQLIVSATNLINHGQLEVGSYGLLSLSGAKVDCSRGYLRSGGAPGVFDRYWNFGTNQFIPSLRFLVNYPSTPNYFVFSYPQFLPTNIALAFPDATIISNSVTSAEYIYEAGTNRTVQVIFVHNLNPEIGVTIRSFGGSAFNLGSPTIQWSTAETNELGQVGTNSLYLTDTYGILATNIYVTNLVGGVYQSLRPQNFTISSTPLPGLQQANLGTNVFTDKTAAFWGATFVTGAQFSAYGALIASTANATQTVAQIRGAYGRVEVAATRDLDLNLSKIDGFNYLKISGTNHFSGSSNAFIGSPYSDIALGSTNGSLKMTSMLKASVGRFAGSIDVYSTVWTNTVVFNGSTNPVLFNALIVDSSLSNRVPARILDLSLRSTNVFIGDNFEVLNNLSIDANSLTLTNGGSLNVNIPGVLWRTSVPHLRGLTNYGSITFSNAIVFASTNANGTDRPYDGIYNAGRIRGASITALATNFFNSGNVTSTAGALVISAVSNLVLVQGGVLSAPLSDISLTARDLSVSNHTISAGRSLTLNVAGQLTAGTNDWQVFNGVNFPTKPVGGDLALVKIRSQSIQSQSVTHTWPGLDRGAVSAGFVTNAALGVLNLNGTLNSQFVFAGNGAASNAMYIDRLELLNTAGQLDSQGNLSQVLINPGMTVYYAQATIDGASAAEFLNGKNGGRLRWISTYAGPFSGTNVVYPDGSTNYLNAALVGSCNIDSDGDGTVNCIDPSPIFLPQLAKLKVSVVNLPAPMISLTWPTIAGAGNRIYDKTNSAASWHLITNLVSPSGMGTLTNEYLTPMGKGSRYFRVEIQPAQ